MKNLKQWQKVIFSLLLGVGLFAVWVYYPQGVWPFVNQFPELETLGDHYDVEILRDTYGVPHIFGQTDADAAFGLGFAHAEDDFLTIQQAFVAARGKLGQAYGIEAAPNDYMVALLRIWDVVDTSYATIPPEVQAVMDGYADGVNYYAALHPDKVLLPELLPITGPDVAAGFIHRLPLFFGLDGVLGELFAEERQRSVSEREIGDAGWGNENVWQGGPTHLPASGQFGSNVIAVSPRRSANGETFFTVNSHQPWEGIVAWYEAHMHSEEGWDMVGGLLPGSPTITHGHNRHLAWAFTVNAPDLIDVFVLEINPDDPDQYLFDGQWLDLEVGSAPITVNLSGRLNWTVRREVLWSVYGPVVRQEHGTYAIRYAGIGEIDHVEQFLRLNKATSFEEWRAAMAEGPLPMFNAGYADNSGTIYYVYNGRIPIRTEGYDWSQYIPGTSSETLWTETFPFDQLPQVLNPEAGFIQNSNNSPFHTTLNPENPAPENYPPELGINDTMSNRSLRSLELFGNDDSITFEEFYRYKFDMGYTGEADVVRAVEMILARPAPEDEPLRQAYLLLSTWDRQTNPENQSAAIAILTLYYLLEHQETKISVSNMTAGTFTPDIVWSSFEQAVDLLMANFGRIDVAWQEVNRLVRGEVDLGIGGAPDVLHAVYGELQENGRFHGVAGDSYIMMIEWDAAGNLSSQSIHQYGSATLDETSPHYADQAPIFVQRQLKPVWMNRIDIEKNLEVGYRPGERP